MEKIYNSKLICIPSGTSMKTAKEAMIEYRIRHLPVIAEDQQIIGMLSKHDLTDIEKFKDLPVDLFLTFPIISVDEEIALSRIALIMLENKISSVILKDKASKAIGIITSDDLLFEFSKLAKKIESEEDFDLIEGLVPNNAGELVKRLQRIVF
jgi:acetoin utilization protein AcuB